MSKGKGELEKRIKEKGMCFMVQTLTKEIRFFKDEPPNYIHFEDLNEILSEMKGEFPKIKVLEEMKDYILTHCVKYDNGVPIFSARHFAGELDKEIEIRKKWMG